MSRTTTSSAWGLGAAPSWLRARGAPAPDLLPAAERAQRSWEMKGRRSRRERMEGPRPRARAESLAAQGRRLRSRSAALRLVRRVAERPRPGVAARSPAAAAAPMVRREALRPAQRSASMGQPVPLERRRSMPAVRTAPGQRGWPMAAARRGGAASARAPSEAGSAASPGRRSGSARLRFAHPARRPGSEPKLAPAAAPERTPGVAALAA